MRATRNLRLVCTALGALSLFVAESANAQPSMSFAVTLPGPVRVSQVAVAAQNIQINAGVAVTGTPDSVVVHMGTLPFIGVGGVLPALYTVGGAVMTLTIVDGKVRSEAPVLGILSNIRGGIVNGPFGRRQSDPIEAQFPAASAGNVNAWGIAANIALQPGRYGNASASAFGKLRLSSGKYYFDNLSSTATGTVEIDASTGPVEIYVATGLSLAGTTSGDASKILFAYTGTNAAYVAGNFNGTVLAPNAALTMAGGFLTQLRGSFMASSVILAPAVRVAHVPSQIFEPTRIARNVIGTPVVGYNPGYFGCPPAINLPPVIRTDASGRQYYENLSYPANPSACQNSILSCDANDNPIPRPTVAQLNAAPPAGSQCAALGTQAQVAECAIDPDSVTTLCSAGCQPNEVCGSLCLDSACTNSEARCGKVYASCAPLPAASNCETYYQCPNAGTKMNISSNAALGVNPPHNAPGADAFPDEEIAVSQYALIGDACEPYGVLGDSMVSEFGGAAKEEGSDKWGVWYAPAVTLELGRTELGRSRANGKFAATAMGGVAVKARAMGQEIDVFDVQAGLDYSECGLRFVSQALLFGDAIASFDSDGGFDGGLPALGPDHETPWQQKESCGSIYDARKEQAGGTRHANFVARAVLAHYEVYGTTPEMCAKANEMLNGSFDCDMPPYNEDQSRSIVQEWRDHYHHEVNEYLVSDHAFDAAADQLSASGKLTLFNIRQAYSVGAAEATIPLGPINLVIAVEGFGFWELNGAIAAHLSYGLGYGDFWSDSGGIFDLGVPELPENPLDRDMRLTIGPVISPAVGFTALAYVGAGVGPLSVGIEGQVDMIRISLPAALMATMGRVSVPNVRPNPVPEPWAGEPIPGMDVNKGMEWRTNLTVKAGIGMDVLNGRINLAARVNLWFWSKTWRIKMADFTGYNIYIKLYEASLGDPVVGASTFGTEADNVEYTVLAPENTFVPGIANPPALPIPFNELDCVIVE